MAGKVAGNLSDVLAGIGGSSGDARDTFPDFSDSAAAEGLSLGDVQRPNGRVKADEGYTTRVKMPEEKPAKEAKAKAETRPRGTAQERAINEIGDSLEEKIVVTCGLLAGIAPVTSVYGTENADKAVRALMNIAKRRPQVLVWLQKAADGVDALELAKFVAGMVMALQVDFGRMQGDELPARALGVTAVMEQFFWDEDTVLNQNVTAQGVPSFARV